MYAIINKRTKKFLSGTDYRVYPRRQITSMDHAVLYPYIESAETDLKVRECCKDYEVVKVRLEVIGNVHENPELLEVK